MGGNPCWFEPLVGYRGERVEQSKCGSWTRTRKDGEVRWFEMREGEAKRWEEKLQKEETQQMGRPFGKVVVGRDVGSILGPFPFRRTQTGI